MSDQYLTSIPNVSWPGIPCTPGLVAINTPEHGWQCYGMETACPAGTTLYVSRVLDFEWRFCTVDIVAAEAKFGPNLAIPPAVLEPVPALSTWAVLVTVAVLAFVGWWRMR